MKFDLVKEQVEFEKRYNYHNLAQEDGDYIDIETRLRWLGWKSCAMQDNRQPSVREMRLVSAMQAVKQYWKTWYWDMISAENAEVITSEFSVLEKYAVEIAEAEKVAKQEDKPAFVSP